MKSKRAEEYIEDHRLKGSYTEGDFDAWRVSEAVAALIDKVSGRGTWDKNPYVVVYEFELIK